MAVFLKYSKNIAIHQTAEVTYNQPISRYFSNNGKIEPGPRRAQLCVIRTPVPFVRLTSKDFTRDLTTCARPQ